MKSMYLLFCLLIMSIFTTANAVNESDELEVKRQLNYYLWDAARKGNEDVINLLISAKYNLNEQDDKGYTAIILAAYNGHSELVKILINAGADPCLSDKRGNTALMGAVFKGEMEITKQLMKAECNPDARNNARQTAAMYASLFQRKALLEELIKQGADTNSTDINGNSVSSLEKNKINGY